MENDAAVIDCWVDQELCISTERPPVTLAQLIEAGAMAICDGMTPERAAAIAQDFIDEAALERARHKRLEAAGSGLLPDRAVELAALELLARRNWRAINTDSVSPREKSNEIGISLTLRSISHLGQIEFCSYR